MTPQSNHRPLNRRPAAAALPFSAPHVNANQAKVFAARSPGSWVRFLFIAAMIALHAPGLAVAAPPDADKTKAEATAKLIHGSQYMRTNSYAQALAEFEEAFRIFPSPKIFFNIGLANVRLGHFPDAMRAFDRFLVEATDADPETISQAKTQRDFVAPNVAVIEVTGTRAGAEIVVDDRSVGRLPLAAPLYLAPGKHRLVANVAGSGAASVFTKAFDAVGGKRDKIEVVEAMPRAAIVTAPDAAPSPASIALAAGVPPAVTAAQSSEPAIVLVDRKAPVTSESSHGAPLYRRPWFWAAAAGVVVVAVATLWLTVGRSTNYPNTSLGTMNIPGGGQQ